MRGAVGAGRECEFGKEQRLLAASDWLACVAGQGARRRGDTDCLTWTRRDTDSIDDGGYAIRTITTGWDSTHGQSARGG